MSLSFVSKSIQTSTGDGKFVEKAIEGASSANESSSVHKPLFEQLRANREQEEAEREEYQKAIMRGTLALDEEDVAHLDSLRRRQLEQEAKVNQQTEQELAAFRAARADRSEESLEPKVKTQSAAISIPLEETKPKLAPKIIIKRKRVKDDGESKLPDKKAKPTESETTESNGSDSAKPTQNKTSPAGLGSLLTGYDSSSDED